jgi:hypothetical protein
MAGARSEQTALLAMMLHNNGFNTPLRDPTIFNPYAACHQVGHAPAVKVKMTLAELQPMLKRALGK